MSLDEIMTILDEYARQTFSIEEDDTDYTPDTDLFDYGYVDSLGAVEMITYIEERFSCTITQKDISKYPLNTIREIAELVQSKLS